MVTQQIPRLRTRRRALWPLAMTIFSQFLFLCYSPIKHTAFSSVESVLFRGELHLFTFSLVQYLYVLVFRHRLMDSTGHY